MYSNDHKFTVQGDVWKFREIGGNVQKCMEMYGNILACTQQTPNFSLLLSRTMCSRSLQWDRYYTPHKVFKAALSSLHGSQLGLIHRCCGSRGILVDPSQTDPQFRLWLLGYLESAEHLTSNKRWMHYSGHQWRWVNSRPPAPLHQCQEPFAPGSPCGTEIAHPRRC